MKPVDHVNPTVPSNWVRRVEDKRRPQERKQRNPQQEPQDPGQHRDPKQPGHGPDDGSHIIDELA